MASADFDGEHFEKRLQSLKDSQESIQSLSAWCLERRPHHKKIVATWLQVLKKVKVEHRLTLFYLANDVIQYSKRKNFEFVESWGTTLQRATTMVRDEKVKHRILRIFKIWDQRQVYDEEFLADLSGLISAAPKKKIEPQPINVPEEFQAALLISTMRSCSTLEQATDARLKDMRDSNIDIDNAEEFCASLKDRRRVEDAEKEVEAAVGNVECYVRALEAEIRERRQVLELLEQADQFYETQRSEVKIVTNAYRNFGSRVKNLKKKLDDLLPTLISPIPSPDINAPSPSPDSDIDLPGEDVNQNSALDVAPPSMYGSYSQDYEPMPVPAPDMSQGNNSTDFTNNFSSFMGTNVDFDMRNIFADRSQTPTGDQSYNEAMPIEVINMRPSKTDGGEDFGTSFMKSGLPTADQAPVSTGIPGLGLDVPEPRTESPQRPDYTHLSSSVAINTPPPPPRMIGAQGSLHVGPNNHPMSHSTPLPHASSPYSSQNNQNNSITFDGPSASLINPLPPPPLPPPIFLDDEGCYNKLPPKFPTWTSTNQATKEEKQWKDKGKKNINPPWPGNNGENEQWDSSRNDANWSNGMRGKSVLSETPESPPTYEKSSFQDPVQYTDPQTQDPILSSAADVDHRVIPLPMPPEVHLPHRLMKNADVDHRNLISLTGSPANNAANLNDSSPPNSNSLWSNTDQDYRRQNQPGDIVESVDMEMSDEETDGAKQKGRVLVDLRGQDRDMRPALPPQQMQHHMDMDMRVIPLPSNPLTRGQIPSDIRGPLPPMPPFRHGQPEFGPGHPNFRRNSEEFGANHPNFRPNLPPPSFIQNQPDFTSDFSPQQDFHRPEVYDFQENQQQQQQPIIQGQDFRDDSPLRGRYPQQENLHQQHHRESPAFHRGRGRGFPRNRRDRFNESNPNNRRPKPQDQLEIPPENVLNNRPPLLQPPETCVILDDTGMPILPDNSQEEIRSRPQEEKEGEIEVPKRSSPSDIESLHIDGRIEDVEVPVDSEEVASEDRSQEGSMARADEPPRNLSEHLEALMNSGKTTGVNELKRQSTNGTILDQLDEDINSPMKKRTLLPNAPLLLGPPGLITELHPAVIYDYEGQHISPNFRPRLPSPVSPSTGSPFAPWRGGVHQPRGRGNFRGSPRAPWTDRGPRGPPSANFMPRANKRGSPFRGAGNNGGNGGGFRGRGRGAGTW